MTGMGLSGAGVTLVRIALLRASPADLPYAPNLALALVLLYFLLNTLLSPLSAQGLEITALLGVAEILLLALFLWVVLSVWRLRNRFVQTFCATLGCDCAFSVLVLPLAWTLHHLGPDRVQNSPLPFLFFAIVVWNFVVLIHILRQALDTRVHVSVGLNLIYMLCYFQLSLVLLSSRSVLP